MAPRDENLKHSSSSKNLNKQVHFGDSQFEPPHTSRRRTPYPSEEASSISRDRTFKEKQPASDSQPTSQPEGISTFPSFNSETPVPTAGQQIFTHHTTGPQPGLIPPNFTHVGQPAFQPTLHPPYPTHFPTQQSFVNTTTTIPVATFPNFAKSSNMGDYENTGTYDQGVHFQPQVPDTSFGPHVHTYVPRHDNGVGYVQQVAHPGQHVQFGTVQMQPGPIAVPIQQVPIGSVPVVAPIAGNVPQVILQQPAHQPGMGHNVPLAGNMAPQPGPFAIPIQQAPGGFPVGPGGQPVHYEPALGIGSTASEIIMQHAQFAQENNLFEPQDFKPADDDPSRMYMCRELDGNWTQRTRYTIDNIGCRWYLTDEGYFYAVRLPN